jgi:hypothetical protein
VQHHPPSISTSTTPQTVSQPLYLGTSVEHLFSAVNAENDAAIGVWETNGNKHIYEEDGEDDIDEHMAPGSIDPMLQLIDDMDYLCYAHVNK